MSKFLFTIITIWLFSSATFAQTLVVTKGKYKIESDNEYSAENAQIVADTIAKTAKEAGWEIKKADLECTDKKCLEKAAKDLKTDNAIYVTVNQSSSMYEFKIIILNGEGTTASKIGPFAFVIKELSQIIKETLGAPPPPKEEKTVVIKEVSMPKPSEDSPAEVEVEPETSNNKKTLKILFGVSLGLTLANAITGIITTGLNKKSFDKLENTTWNNSKEWDEEKNHFNKLKVTSWVFLSATGVFAVTTTIFGILAFKKDKKKDKNSGDIATKVSPAKNKLSISLPILSNGGAMLLLKRKF